VGELEKNDLGPGSNLEPSTEGTRIEVLKALRGWDGEEMSPSPRKFFNFLYKNDAFSILGY
jgi:hypothetical protein